MKEQIIKWVKENKITAGILITFALAIIAGSIVIYKQNENYNTGMQNQYRQALYNLADSVSNIDVSLSKALLAGNPKHLAMIANEIQRDASYAKACLGLLPISDTLIETTQKFLSQVGDYTAMLSVKSIHGQEITDEEYDTLLALSQYAGRLDTSILELENQMLNSDKKFSDIIAVTASANKAGEEPPANAFAEIEEMFIEYPSLIYDGPFSDHIDKIEPQKLKGQTEFTQDMAREKALEFLDYANVKEIKSSSNGEGRIHTYGFIAKTGDKDRNIYVDVTKYGGFIISVLDTKPIQEHMLTNEEALAKSAEFLEGKGYEDFKYSYFEKSDGVLTVNFAATQDGVVLYPDLIKVKVTLDDGTIIGLEAKNYIAHNRIREDLIPQITLEEAQNAINKRLTISASSLCVIPLNNGTEVFCYEFKGNLDNKSFLYYVNAKTGMEERILLVVDTENGVLTM